MGARTTADSTGNCLAAGRRSRPVSFSRPLVSTCRASPQIDEAAHAQSVGDLLQAVAGRREDAAEEPALTELCEP